jgi:lipopolysaccharide biosynthesis glycosyltransferase
VSNNDISISISPYFKHKNIPVVFACDNNYSPYLGVCIKSILENADASRNYDLIVLQTAITSANQMLLQLLVSNYKNAFIRFVDITKSIGKIQLPIHNYFTKETYYRLFLPKILENYNKIIYLDVDLVVLKDISKLYDINVDECLIGATRDFGMIKNYLKDKVYRKHKVVKYCHEKLFLDKYDSLNYSQAGVLLMNLEEMRKIDFINLAIGMLARYIYILVDQDILNSICRKRIKRIPHNWDFIDILYEKDKEVLPYELNDEYNIAQNDPYIIHFGGEEKPWLYNVPFAHLFWKYARKTSYYEELLLKCCEKVTSRTIQDTKIFYRKFIKYKILQFFTFGKIEKINQKKNIYAEKLSQLISAIR